MGTESRWVSQGPPRSPDLELHHSNQPESHCELCRRFLSVDNEGLDGFESLYILCRECKIAFLENIDTSIEVSQRRSPRGGRRRSRNSGSSESIEDMFSQQFSHLINLVRQNHHTISRPTSEHGSFRESESSTRVLQDMGTYARLGRWRRAFSDNGSEGFDNLDSIFSASDTNASISGYGALYGESDTVSFSAYGGNSDLSMDGQSLPDTEMYPQWDDSSHFDSETDIDPMNAGLVHWNLTEEDDVEEAEQDGDWGEADAEEEEEAVGTNEPTNWGLVLPPRNESHDLWGMQETEYNLGITYIHDIADLEEEIIERFVETTISRRGPPPAALSVVGNLPSVIINMEHEKNGILICAICKDQLELDTVANQLPCLHLYHPPCILPWLSSRNSCPVCRYELPTDDLDYEEGKLRLRNQAEILEAEDNPSEDGFSEVEEIIGFLPRENVDGIGVMAAIEDQIDRGSRDLGASDDRGCREDGSTRERGSRGWLFLAAAPIVSVVGIVLVLWLGNPLVDSGSISRWGRGREAQVVQGSFGGSSGLGNAENRGRKWWSLF